MCINWRTIFDFKKSQDILGAIFQHLIRAVQSPVPFFTEKKLYPSLQFFWPQTFLRCRELDGKRRKGGEQSSTFFRLKTFNAYVEFETMACAPNCELEGEREEKKERLEELEVVLSSLLGGGRC